MRTFPGPGSSARLRATSAPYLDTTPDEATRSAFAAPAGASSPGSRSSPPIATVLSCLPLMFYCQGSGRQAKRRWLDVLGNRPADQMRRLFLSEAIAYVS